MILNSILVNNYIKQHYTPKDINNQCNQIKQAHVHKLGYLGTYTVLQDNMTRN